MVSAISHPTFSLAPDPPRLRISLASVVRRLDLAPRRCFFTLVIYSTRVRWGLRVLQPALFDTIHRFRPRPRDDASAPPYIHKPQHTHTHTKEVETIAPFLGMSSSSDCIFPMPARLSCHDLLPVPYVGLVRVSPYPWCPPCTHVATMLLQLIHSLLLCCYYVAAIDSFVARCSVQPAGSYHPPSMPVDPARGMLHCFQSCFHAGGAFTLPMLVCLMLHFHDG
jgi:hypothetical protein